MIDYLVSNQNNLNRAIPRAEAALDAAGKRWRKNWRDADREAINDWAVILTILQLEQGEGRRRIAKECEPWFDNSAFPNGKFVFQWHSTPALWGAVRPDYDGAPDSGCQQGFGKTKAEAAWDLVEREEA